MKVRSLLLMAGAILVCQMSFAVTPFKRGDAITPAVNPNVCPDSMFGSNTPAYTPELRKEQAKLGVKWMRNGLDDDKVARELGYSQLFITDVPRNEDSITGGVFGAPKPESIDKWIKQQVDTLKAHPEVRALEFYNEPWWMYQGATMKDFRELLRRTYLAVKAYDPGILVLVGNSSSAVRDDIAIDDYPRYCDGFTVHIYQSTGTLNAMDQPFLRYGDFNSLLCTMYDKKENWITEGGEMFPAMMGLGEPLGYSAHDVGMCMGYKQLQRHASYPFVGIDKVFNHMHDGGWNSPEMFETYKMMTTLLEGKKAVMESWPRSMLTSASIFAEAGQSSAIIWSWCSKETLKNDAGVMTIKDVDDLAAYDSLGKPYGTFDEATKTYSLPVGNMPFYLVTSQSAEKLNAIILKADLVMPNPMKAMVEPFCGPVGATTPVRVRLYNGGTRSYQGSVTAEIADWKTTADVPFTVNIGDFVTVNVPVTAAKANDKNIYQVKVTVKIDGIATPMIINQAAQAAYMVAKTPKIDGKLDDWKGNIPVTMATYPQEKDFGSLALNPALLTQAVEGGNKEVQNEVIKLYSAYDKDFLYIAYELQGKRSSHDWVQIALGLTDWSPHNIRDQYADYAYKGYYIDSDYLIALNNPVNSIWKLATPRAKFRSPYEWMQLCTGASLRMVSEPEYENSVFYDMVAKTGAKIAVSDVNDIRVVECAIPRSEIPEFTPENQQPIRMSFILQTAADTSADSSWFEWSRVHGDFSFMSGFGSFIPSWQNRYSNQLHWGVK